MAFTDLHIFAELSEVHGTDSTSKEKLASDQPTHRHMVNMVFPAQYEGDGLYSVPEIGQSLKFLCTPVSLLFGTTFCVCGYCLPAGAFEGFGDALVFMETLFAQAAVKGNRALACLGIIAVAFGFKVSGTFFHFYYLFIKLKMCHMSLIDTVYHIWS